MHSISKKIILMTLLIFVFTILFSCAKDSDLLLDSVLNESEVSIEEKNKEGEEEVTENNLVSRTFTFSPTNDAYVQETQGHDQSIIRLQEGYRTSYLMFDLSTINGSITNAILQFSVDSDEGDGNIAVHKGESTNWTEGNLSIDNAPAIEVQLGSLNESYKVGAPEKVVLNTTDLKAEITTLVMIHSNGNDLAFASKEHLTNKGPQLIITYQTTENSPVIEPQEEDTDQEQPTLEEDNEPNNNTAFTEEGIYFVTINGKATNDGHSEATSWNIEHAFDRAIAGNTVHVKAGNYGNVRLNADNSGTINNLISFVGYKDIPGDIASSVGPTFSYQDYKNNGDNLDATKMPLLIGTRSNGIGSGMGIEIRQESNIRIENFMITKHEYGIFNSGGNNNVFKNIITTDHGDFNPQNSWALGNSPAFANLKGTGIRVVSSNEVEIANSIAINNGARGIALVASKNSKIINSSAYSDNNTNPTDYYIMLYKTTESQVINCHVERVGDLAHFGHGFSVKVDAAFNQFKDCTTKGTGFELNNRIHHNTFTDCHVQGTGKALSGGWEVTNYSHDNTFINCSNDSGEGIVFSDWPEDDGNNGINTAAFNNTFKNCVITNVVAHSGAAIDFHFNSQAGRLTSYARDNTFEGCTFSGADYLFKVDRVNSGNTFINCNISDIENLRHSRLSNNTALQLDVTFENTTTSNIGFTLPD